MVTTKSGGGSGSFGGGSGGGSFRDYVAELEAIANRQAFQVHWMSPIVESVNNTANVLRAVMSTSGFKGAFGDELVRVLDDARKQASSNAIEIENIQQCLEYANNAMESAKWGLEALPDPGLSVGEIAVIEAKYALLGVAGVLLAQQEIDRATQGREEERQQHAKEFLDKLGNVLDDTANRMNRAAEGMKILTGVDPTGFPTRTLVLVWTLVVVLGVGALAAVVTVVA